MKKYTILFLVAVSIVGCSKSKLVLHVSTDSNILGNVVYTAIAIDGTICNTPEPKPIVGDSLNCEWITRRY